MNKKKWFFIPIIILVTTLIFFSCTQKKISRYTIEYSTPYFAINPSTDISIYLNPGESSKILYHLEAYRIVKVTASVTLANPKPIWYQIRESNIAGYVLSKGFKLFNTQKEAEQFLFNKFPDGKLLALLSIYKLAFQDYQKGDLDSSIAKLIRFVTAKDDFKMHYPTLFYNTKILIGRLYIQKKKYQQGILYYQELMRDEKSDAEISLFGSQFNPRRVYFHIQDIELYLKKLSFKHRSIKLRWEILYYLSKAYELNKLYHKAIEGYLNLLCFNKDDRSYQSKILYINRSIDNLSQLKEKKERIVYLKSLKASLDWQGNARYILIKLAILLLKKENLSQKDSSKNKALALSLYHSYIQLFEKKYHENPYQGEIAYYLMAKEQVGILSQFKEKEKILDYNGMQDQ